MATKTRAAKAKTTDAVADKARVALAFARQVAARTTGWVELHNALYGIGGKCGELFPTPAERAAFVKTDEHREIMELLRDKQRADASQAEPPPDASGRFVLRLPMSLHAALMAEAKAEGISLNQLCVAKLATQLRATALLPVASPAKA